MEDYLIEDIKEFQVRTKNSLIMIGITHISNLACLSPRDLRFIYGIGKKGRKTILEFCLKNGIQLSEKDYYLDV
ncbi:hypothetical protein EZ428_12940 [Pedobacter frigiditerrae]|uniref:RNA polymerase alpha subunit C-terminal domain-containing protein n=1 Tax=Pedobacter frigiditerrae TaxID=2530452 RepID=A0A4R0MW88_9SPHI|nr:hypothetical protein [Pedobacter frigiditerrae]TCC90184.1 hypothetical protein EZ428_12940 [Pedobacter frigiditerrae]